jgi:hypothetical protein
MLNELSDVVMCCRKSKIRRNVVCSVWHANTTTLLTVSFRSVHRFLGFLTKIFGVGDCPHAAIEFKWFAKKLSLLSRPDLIVSAVVTWEGRCTSHREVG